MLNARFDLSALLALEEELERLGSPAFRNRLNERLATAALRQLRLEFDESRDPLGQPWAALRTRVGRPLVRTSRLARSFGSRVGGSGFAIGTNVPFAGYHQAGTPTVPARPMLPEGRLGPDWARALEAGVDGAVERLFGSGS